MIVHWWEVKHCSKKKLSNKILKIFKCILAFHTIDCLQKVEHYEFLIIRSIPVDTCTTPEIVKSHARMPIVCRSGTAVWVWTQRWSMSLDILDWPEYRRGLGTEQGQSLNWDSVLNYCQILPMQLSKTGSDNDWHQLRYSKIHNKMRVFISWRNLGTKLFVSSLSSLGWIFFRNCR